ncbi:MAG: oligosaccharide flippase family protein, partial [Elusimicrobiales bacterium]|nr:oligosaccharide flippase family protein [Elusimicrobiales bacterium]
MTRHGYFRTLVKGSTIAFAGNGLIYAMAFVFQLMLVRFLGAENYGVWNFAWTLALTAAQLSAMGLGLAAIYFISGKHEGGPGPSDAAGTALRISLTSAVAAALLLPALGRIWIVPAYGFHGLQSLITVLAAAIPFISLTNMLECVFRGHQDAAAAFKMKLVPEALKLMVVPAALLVFGADKLTVAVSVASVMLAPALYGAYMFHKLVLPVGTLFSPVQGGRAAAPLLRYAMPFFLLEVFQLLRDRADTFIIGYLSTASY